MARLARVVVPGIPHHVTQRGTRRMQVFLSRSDYRAYRRTLQERARKHDLAVWTYCLMPNHVHLIVAPSSAEGLARPIGEAHHQFARGINQRHGWAGHLWQERFRSCPMDEPHLLAAIRYVLLNPVRAGLTRTATEWPHSSARAHILGQPDPLVDCGPCAERIHDWDLYLADETSYEAETEALRNRGNIGRPLGSKRFVAELERITNRRLRPHKVGRKPKPK